MKRDNKSVYTALATAIDNYESRNSLKFKPDEGFYERIAINRIRFWQLVKGKKPMYIHEAVKLSEYFGVPATTFLHSQANVTA